MSVVGFDLGSDLSKVAVAHRKKIQVVPNELTKLITPTLTAFGDKERHFGDTAKTQWNRNYKNTVSQLTRWLGTKANDPKLHKEATFWLPGCKTGQLPDGRFAIHCQTSQGDLLLAPEQILSGFLIQLKKFTTTFLEGLKVTDCVIACPSYFDDAQRRALLTAAKLAELKVLRLLEEPTAIALNYGILRNLPENETQRVIFVDIGYSATQVAIVDFVKGKLSVRYKSSNPFVGGRDLDHCLYEIFRKRWLSKHNTDVDNIPKAKLKLLRAAKDIKKILTGNKEAHWTLDCFHNDNDFNILIDREEMQNAAEEEKLYEAICEPIIEALEATKGDKIKIHSCEVVGGVHRVPSVQKAIFETVKKYEEQITSLSFTLNGDESVARGCALMCAMLSPNFRVKEFQVQDIITWPITISYPSDQQQSKTINQLVMQRGNPQPCTAKVTFNKTQNFVFKLQHPEEYKTKNTDIKIEYPFQTNLDIGEFNVQLLPLNEKAIQPPKIKILLDINKQGLLDWPKASLIEWVKREPKPEPEPKKTDDKEKEKEKETKKETETETEKKDEKKDDNKDKKEEKEEPKTDDNAMDVDEESSATNNEEKTDDKNKKDEDNDAEMNDKNNTDNKETTKKKKDKKKLTRDLIITGNFFNDLKASEFNKWFELEAKLINVDRIVHETYEAKNDLETYIYALRDKIESSHRDYIKESKREQLSKELTEMEDWVYDEGDDANKTQFLERLKQLKDVGNPMEFRAWEFQHREQRVTMFKKLIFGYQQFMENKEEKYEHIGEDKRKEVKKYADDADAWLTNNLIKQDRLKKYEDPAVKCKDIDNKYRELYDKCQPIINTPKPPPPKKEEEKKDDKTTENGDAKDSDNKDKDKKDEDNDTEMKPKNDENDNTDTPKTNETNDAASSDKQNDANDSTKVDGMEVE